MNVSRVQRQRHDPEQRRRHDIGGEVLRHAKQQRGRHQRQRDPQRALPTAMPARRPSGAALRQRVARCPTKRCVYAHAATSAATAQKPTAHAARLNAPRGDRLDQPDIPAAPAGFRRCSRRTGSTDRPPWDRSCARTIAAAAGPSPRARRTAGRRCRPALEAPTTADRPPPGSPMSIGSGSMTLAASSTHDVHQPLPRPRHARAQRVGVEVSQQQHGLEEDHAAAPHRRAAAEDRQQNLAGQRLHHEEQRRGEEDREREERRRGGKMTACPEQRSGARDD